MHEASVEFSLLNYQWFRQVRSNIPCPSIYIQYLDLQKHHCTCTWFFWLNMSRNLKNQSKHMQASSLYNIFKNWSADGHATPYPYTSQKFIWWLRLTQGTEQSSNAPGWDGQTTTGRSIPWQAGNKFPSFSIEKKYESSVWIIFHLKRCFFATTLRPDLYRFILDQTNGTMPCFASELATKSCLYNGYIEATTFHRLRTFACVKKPGVLVY